MTTIWYQDITDILLNIADPNTWGVVSEVPGVSTPKINAWVSVYNVEADWGIAWWSTDITWSASDYNTVGWTSGNIYLPDWKNLAITSGNTGNMSWTTYIYYDSDLWSVQTTTSASASVGKNKILLCVASPTSSWKDAEFQAFGTNAQSTFITADNIAANTITGNEIAANSITSWKIDVDYLSAISADLGSIQAWDITWTTIIAWSTSGTAVKLNPTKNRIEFYYGWNQVGTMVGQYVSWLWNAVVLSWSYVWIWSNVMIIGKLKIPVWTNLYD